MIGHCQVCQPTIAFERNLDRVALPVACHRIREKVRDDLLQAKPIPRAGDGRQARGDLWRLHLLLESTDDGVKDGLSKIHIFDVEVEASRGDARDIEEIVDQPGQSLGGVDRLSDPLAGPRTWYRLASSFRWLAAGRLTAAEWHSPDCGAHATPSRETRRAREPPLPTSVRHAVVGMPTRVQAVSACVRSIRSAA